MAQLGHDLHVYMVTNNRPTILVHSRNMPLSHGELLSKFESSGLGCLLCIYNCGSRKEMGISPRLSKVVVPVFVNKQNYCCLFCILMFINFLLLFYAICCRKFHFWCYCWRSVWSSVDHYYHPHPFCHHYGPIYEAEEYEVSLSPTSIGANPDLVNYIF